MTDKKEEEMKVEQYAFLLLKNELNEASNRITTLEQSVQQIAERLMEHEKTIKQLVGFVNSRFMTDEVDEPSETTPQFQAPIQ